MKKFYMSLFVACNISCGLYAAPNLAAPDNGHISSVKNNPFITGAINKKVAAPMKKAPTRFISQCSPMCETDVTMHFRDVYTKACKLGGDAQKRIQTAISRFQSVKIARKHGQVSPAPKQLAALEQFDEANGTDEAAKMRARAVSDDTRAEVKAMNQRIDSSCTPKNITLISRPDLDNNSSFVTINGVRRPIVDGEMSNPLEAHMKCMDSCRHNPKKYLGAEPAK